LNPIRDSTYVNCYKCRQKTVPVPAWEINMDMLKERLKNVPLRPGVYMFKDQEGIVIYVGKAKVLRNRMRSYFQSRDRLHPKVRAMMNRVGDFDFIVTGTEVEALILENNLIKEYRPRYNIDLRDDKTYPYLKISTAEKFPRMYITREKKDNISRYFGPYTDAASLREMVKILAGIFPLRTCRKFRYRSRPCLTRDIEKCLAPCMGNVSVEEYHEMVNALIRVMEGDITELVDQREAEMKKAAADLDFEKAACLRDQIVSIRKVNEKQNINFEKPYDLDLSTLIKGDNKALVLLFKIRSGKIIDRDTVWLNCTMDEDEGQLIQYFLQHYYNKNHDIPREILVNVSPADILVVEEWLKNKSGRKVRLNIPQRGNKRAMLNMLQENAELLFKERIEGEQAADGVLLQLSKNLGLEEIPQRIECYDISHLAGEETVASMVVFTSGVPDKANYRRFKISVDQNDDFASLAETIRRRFNESKQGNAAFLPEPDLLLIDGGLGQVNAVHKILQEMNVDIPLFSLAKKEEEIYKPGISAPFRLKRSDKGLMLLQRLRDEAHRFAIEYNRSRRQKKVWVSTLDNVPGIGNERKKTLLSHFGSAAQVKGASINELETVPGISKNLARNIYNYFRQNKE